MEITAGKIWVMELTGIRRVEDVIFRDLRIGKYRLVFLPVILMLVCMRFVSLIFGKMILSFQCRIPPAILTALWYSLSLTGE